jgi:mRNA interferase HicA
MRHADKLLTGLQGLVALTSGQKCPTIAPMKGSEFIRKIRKLGRKRNVDVAFIPERGKGSHGTLYYGERLTVVKHTSDELRTGTLKAMLKQLGLTLSDLNQ